MNKEQELKKKISELEDRVKYLEEINRLSLDALDQASHLGDFQTSISKLESKLLILDETRSRIRSLIPFEADAFYLVDESNSEFYLEECQPEDYRSLFINEIDIFVEDGTFAWAIREKRPVIITADDKKRKVLLHVITTSTRVRGMFVGILTHGEMDVTLVSLSLISIILRYSANALESFELYSMIKVINSKLECSVHNRTMELQYQLQFEHMVARLLTAFIDIPPSEMCDTINQTLRSIAEFTGANKYFISFFNESKDLALCVQKVESQTFISAENESYMVGIDEFPYIKKQIIKHKPFNILDVSALPDFAVNEKTYFFEMGVQSAVIVPMISGENPAGFFGFGFKKISNNSSSDISGLLKIIGEIIIIALNRVKTNLALQSSQDQLRQAQKMDALGRLAGGVAHDFNNILTAITITSEFALQQTEISSNIEQKFHEILRASQRASNLTRQLLTVSRRQIIMPKLMDIGYVISDLNRMLRRLIPEDIEIDLKTDQETIFIKADLGQIEQILINLTVNARDAIMEKTGNSLKKKITITITKRTLENNCDEVLHNIVSRSGDFVLIHVADSGAGMDRDTCRRIFEPFFTTKLEGKGTGLGLATVYGIVKQNNGGISVKSEPGKGTAFSIFWPAAESTQTAMLKKESSKKLQNGGSETILLVEDDNDIRKAVKELLELMGYIIIDAENGKKAINVAESYESKIDLLITDMMMPIMGGKQLAEKILEMFPFIKIIYTTGYNNSPMDITESLPPNSRFIQKPYSVNAILRLIRELISNE